MGFGKDLKDALEMRGVNVRTLAAWTGIPASTLYTAISTDAEKTSVENMTKIAAALDLPPDYFFSKTPKFETAEEYKKFLEASSYYSEDEIEIMVRDWNFENGFRKWSMDRRAPHKAITEQIEKLNYNGLQHVIRFINILSTHPDYIKDTDSNQEEKTGSHLPPYQRPRNRPLSKKDTDNT